MIVTRFAPSPSGYLHIGNARTALFNYLLARSAAGKFLLRIEDTNKEKSSKEAIEAIISSLKWLKLDWDGEVVFQSQQASKHKAAAEDLIKKGRAYYCFTPQEEIDSLRQEAIASGKHFIFKSKWRDASQEDYPADIKPVVRLKAPRIGQTIIKDKLQGEVVIENEHLDDMVLLRSDGSPTYMLAVVVDDHDMGVTHIIRGDDHLTNAARQILIYDAFGWEVPVMVHVPLIHGPDGAKLSKRHGALGVEAYREMGYLPESLANYLLRLGWSHGNDEIIPLEKAIEWFNLSGLGKSPARLDFLKMNNLNAHYLRNKTDNELTDIIISYLTEQNYIITEAEKSCILKGVSNLKVRAQLTPELADLAEVYLIDHVLEYSHDALEAIKSTEPNLIASVIQNLNSLSSFEKETIEGSLKSLALKEGIKIGDLMGKLRPLITGRVTSPSVFEIMSIIGLTTTLKRLEFKV